MYGRNIAIITRIKNNQWLVNERTSVKRTRNSLGLRRGKKRIKLVGFP